jgi:hypothetical protein
VRNGVEGRARSALVILGRFALFVGGLGASAPCSGAACLRHGGCLVFFPHREFNTCFSMHPPSPGLSPCRSTIAAPRGQWPCPADVFFAKFRVMFVREGVIKGLGCFCGLVWVNSPFNCDVLCFNVPRRLFFRVDDYWHGYKLFCYAYYSNSVAHEGNFRRSKLGALQSTLSNCICFVSLRSQFGIHVSNLCLCAYVPPLPFFVQAS